MIPMDQGDVSIAPIDNQCDDCENLATHQVEVFFRSAGYQQALGRYCHKHANEMADRIRDGLPLEAP